MKEKLRFFLSEDAKQAGACLVSPREGDAGFDLRSSESFELSAGQDFLVSTGLFVSIPLGWVGVVKERSSLAVKGVSVHAGVIDASYRGELKVLLHNRTSSPITFDSGSKIAQMLVIPHLLECEERESQEALGATSRGEQGFGSTGIK